MKKHSLTLMGGPRDELRISAALLQETLKTLLSGARLATRFAVEGESVRKGPRPAWLESACAVDVTGLSAGSAVIATETPTLQEADVAKFGDLGQRPLFGEIDRGFAAKTAIDLFGQVLASIIEQDIDAVVADRALLNACARFAKISGDGFVGVQLEGLHGRDAPLIVTHDHVPLIELLRDETPPPQATRVAGTLDTISASRSDMILKLKDGTTVPARMDDRDPDALRELFGETALISGVAHYRPSGRLLMVDVESIGKAGAGSQLFETFPVARRRLLVAPPVPQDGSSGVAAFFGTWPGDESEDELLEALQIIE